MIKKNFYSQFILWTALAISIFLPAPVEAAPLVYRARVLLPGGKPAIGAKVALQQNLRFLKAEEVKEINAVTDGEGKFSIEIPHDNSGFPESFLAIDVTGCALQFSWMWNWEKENAIQLAPDVGVEGSVVGLQNEPVADVEVVVTTAGVGTYTPVNFQSPQGIIYPSLVTRSDANGKFRVRSVRLDNYWDGVSASAHAVRDGHVWMGYADNYFIDEEAPISNESASEQKTKKNKLNIYLEPTLTVRGRVLHSQTGAPIEKAGVSYYGFERSQVLTDAHGRFELKDIFVDRGIHFSVSIPKSSGVDSDLIQVARSSDKVAQAGLVEELTIRVTPFVQISGTVKSEERNSALPFRTTLYVKQTQAAGEGWTQGTGSSTSTFVGDAQFTMRAPVGENQFSITDANGDKTIDDLKQALQIPANGLDNLEIKVHQNPGYLIRFEPKNQTDSGPQFRLYARTPGEPRYLASNERRWFGAAQKWGETMEIRGVDSNGKEFFGWTKITAAPENWPTVIQLP